MFEKKYKVLDKFGETLAAEMELDMALIFIKGFAAEVYNEDLELRIVEIKQMKREA